MARGVKQKMPPRSTSLHGKGPIAASAKELWVRAAERAILDLVESELALVPPELEARLSDTGVVLDGKRYNFDPHILSEATRHLRAVSALGTQTHLTKGGARVTAYVPGNRHRRETAVAKRVARKSMLYRRFLALSATAGEAGEQVLRNSMKVAAASGVPYLPMSRHFGEVRELLNTRLHGPFDSGAFLHATDASGIPIRPIALPIEVKNRRLTVYPIHKELHQLLAKAAQVQMAEPDYPITPVLICRKAHARLFWMAADLGFRVWATRRQFVYASKDIDERKITELRTELGLADLTIVDRDNPPLIDKFLKQSLPAVARRASDDWATYAELVSPYAEALRKDDLEPRDRTVLVDELRNEILDLRREDGEDPPFTWAISEDEVHEDHPEP